MEDIKEKIYDFVVIGAGVAGLTAAQYGARGGLDTLLLDTWYPGGQALNIFNLENFPGFFPSINGGDFIENMRLQAENFGAKILQGKVNSIDKSENRFVIESDAGKIFAYAVLIATGAEHRKLGVPGEEKFFGKGVSYCATCDGPFFKRKKIVVVGGGDSALEEAIHLTSFSDDVTLVHRRDEFRAQKAIQDKVFKNKKITVKFNSEIESIEGEEKVSSVVLKNRLDSSTQKIECDGVFVSVGMKPLTSLVDTLKKDEVGYLITNYKMETEIPGLYVAGDVRAKPFRQLVTAASDGAIAAHMASEYVSTIKSKSL
ncbi:thioredoxin-disulfide reductase [Treponema pectinovorum]|uniref:thioredoxin-disulfide reductase n=1 Tax=Treponema pectinovorum TaxID=164 RepID=UPI0011C8B6F6|nr:thioredoxin-disulfide reductase [Treponema pectinovorum]